MEEEGEGIMKKREKGEKDVEKGEERERERVREREGEREGGRERGREREREGERLLLYKSLSKVSIDHPPGLFGQQLYVPLLNLVHEQNTTGGCLPAESNQRMGFLNKIPNFFF